MEKGLSAVIFQRCWRRCKARRAAWESLRPWLEMLVDVYSGQTYYLDNRTGRIHDNIRTLFGAKGLHGPADWVMRVAPEGHGYYERRYQPPPRLRAKSEMGMSTIGRSVSFFLPDGDGDDEAADAGGTAMPGAEYGADGKPNQVTAPPEGYTLCAVCGADFADRRCHGDECDGSPYCYNCFQSYHPRDHEQYAAHWSTFARIPVRPYERLRDDDLPLHLRSKRRARPTNKPRLPGQSTANLGLSRLTPVPSSLPSALRAGTKGRTRGAVSSITEGDEEADGED